MALLTDHVFHDESMLRWSMAIVAATAVVLGIAALFYVRPHFRALIDEAEPPHPDPVVISWPAAKQ